VIVDVVDAPGNMGQHSNVVRLPSRLCTCLAYFWSCTWDGWNGMYCMWFIFVG